MPKNRGAEFVDLIEELTHDTCVEGEPDCPRCELRKICPTGQARKAEPRAKAAKAAAAEGGRSARTKSADSSVRGIFPERPRRPRRPCLQLEGTVGSFPFLEDGSPMNDAYMIDRHREFLPMRSRLLRPSGLPRRSRDPAFAAEKDIVDTAVGAGSFKTLVAAVKAAGLVDTLKGDGPVHRPGPDRRGVRQAARRAPSRACSSPRTRTSSSPS